MFGTKGHHQEAFVSNGFQNWKSALEKFRAHQCSVAHKSAILAWEVGKQIQHNPERNVVSLINQQQKKVVDENRQYLKNIVETLVFIGRQGISLRGHRENEESLNKGNFLELLMFQAKNNPLISRFFANKEKNVTYTSPGIQNDLLNVIGENIRDSTINQIKDARMFALILDESLDISRHEQAAVVLRYMNPQFVVNERFIGFFRATQTDGESLYHLVQTVLMTLDLNIDDIVAQCYDGAANMRGMYKGVAARIKRDNPRAIYVHCNGHILNLVLVDAAKAVIAARNTFGTISELHNFMEASAKRHAVFQEIQKQSGCKSLTLKSLSDTRWACRAEALKVIKKRLEDVITSLQKITDEDPSSGAQAQSLLNSICTFDFVFNLVILDEVFNTTKILSKYLQYIDLSICAARSKISAVQESLTEMRSDTEFQKYWKEAIEISRKLELEPPHLPRQRRVPSRLGGGEIQPVYRNVEHYYQVASFYPLLDVIISQLKERFSENDMMIVQNIETVLLADNISSVSQTALEQVSEFYDLDKDNLKAELRVYTNLMKQKEKEQSGVTVQGEDDKGYKILCKRRKLMAEDRGVQSVLPELCKLMKIFWTIPITSCSAERSFSCLRRLKSYLRSTMGQERLTALALLNIERDIMPDIEKIIDVFAEQAPRKLQLCYS